MIVAPVTSVKIKFLTTLLHPCCQDSELLNNTIDCLCVEKT